MTLLEQVVERQSELLAPAHRQRLAAELNLGRAYIGTHQYKKAAKILRQVLEIQRTVRDVTDPYLLRTQHQLARAYLGMRNGHYERAAEILEQVVEIRKRTLAPDDHRLLRSQHNLALAYKRLGSGHYEKAAGLLEPVVAIKERILDPDHPHLLNSQRLLEKVHGLIEAEKDAESTSASGEEV